MKAVVCTEYGPPEALQLREVEKPTPKHGEALVRVQAASVNAADLETLRGDFIVRMAAPRRPMHRILGTDIAGTVEEVRGGAKQFRPGDEVWADLSEHGWGAFAEYVCVPEDALRPKPASMTFEEAAAYPQAAVLALQYLRDKRPIEPGQEVLINGAGGGVGTFAVQIAKYYGAELTGVDSTTKLDLLRSIGADHVIDYTKEDFTKSGQHYDLILDVVARRSVFAYRRALKPDGVCVFVGGSMATILQALILGPLISRTAGQELGIVMWRPNKKEDLAFLAELFEAGKVVPVIDRRYSLSDVPEALRYLAEEPHLGKIVITVADDDNT